MVGRLTQGSGCCCGGVVVVAAYHLLIKQSTEFNRNLGLGGRLLLLTLIVVHEPL